MRDRLILLPGWALGPAALEPLRDALSERAPHLNIEIEALPDLAQPEAWLDELDARLPSDCWLAGWSLGGMLAAQLAARRDASCRGLIGLASNLCFRAREDWPSAMPGEVFAAFHEAFGLDPALTLKRFRLLVSQGAKDPRTLARQLQVTQPSTPPEVLEAGLQLLVGLDTRGALRAYSGPQLHLFAGRDALVPPAACQALLDWLPDVEASIIREASHGLPVECPDAVAEAMLAFMFEGEDV